MGGVNVLTCNQQVFSPYNKNSHAGLAAAGVGYLVKWGVF
jgi:hypothetical protein